MRCRTICASASEGIESARQQVLRLLGEASTLRNQLAQIDEYLAAIERDAARVAQGRRIRVGRSGSPGTGEDGAVRPSSRRSRWNSNRWPTGAAASKKS